MTTDNFVAQLSKVDVGNLLYIDGAPLDKSAVGAISENEMVERGRECAQQLIAKLWNLPKETDLDGTFFVLPQPTFILPREKPAPSARDQTRWERYAKLKGIHNRKKSRRVWDEGNKSWKVRWGKDRINSTKDQWVLEVPDNADPYEDQFEKMNKGKRERQAKNELQRLRNIARTVKKGNSTVPALGTLSETDRSKNEIKRALTISTKSDASMGLFSEAVNVKKVANRVQTNSGRAKSSINNNKKQGKGRPQNKNRQGKERPQNKNNKGKGRPHAQHKNC